MEVEPIKLSSFNLTKSEILNNRLLIAFDQGCSLTKILFFDQKNVHQLSDNSLNYITMHIALFINENMEGVLRWVKRHAYVPDNNNYSIHATGVGGFKYKKCIEEILGRSVETVEEQITIYAGTSLGLKLVGLDSLIHEIETLEDKSPTKDVGLVKYAESIKPRYDKNEANSLFPCIVYSAGSAAGFIYFDENEVGCSLGLLCQGGRNFIGLAKCLLDINNYDELVELAAEGDFKNVHVLAKEVFSEYPDSSSSLYGRLPPELPIFLMGKLADYNKETFERKDIAAALISYKIFEIIANSIYFCRAMNLTRVYMMGNIFISDIFQKTYKKIMSYIPQFIEFKFLDFGYYGALGAMLTSNNDGINHLKFNKK